MEVALALGTSQVFIQTAGPSGTVQVSTPDLLKARALNQPETPLHILRCPGGGGTAQTENLGKSERKNILTALSLPEEMGRGGIFDSWVTLNKSLHKLSAFRVLAY